MSKKSLIRIGAGEKIVVASPRRLALLIGVSEEEIYGKDGEGRSRFDYGELRRRIEAFAKEHAEELRNKPRPMSYMMGFGVSKYDVDRRVLMDPLEIINLLGRYNGGLYVPDRKIRFTRETLKAPVAFFEKEFGYVPQ